jgi:hypothetical protein
MYMNSDGGLSSASAGKRPWPEALIIGDRCCQIVDLALHLSRHGYIARISLGQCLAERARGNLAHYTSELYPFRLGL